MSIEDEDLNGGATDYLFDHVDDQCPECDRINCVCPTEEERNAVLEEMYQEQEPLTSDELEAGFRGRNTEHEGCLETSRQA